MLSQFDTFYPSISTGGQGRGQGLVLIRTAARKHHIVTVDQLRIVFAAQQLIDQVTGLTHDATGIVRRVVDQTASIFHAMLIHASDDIATVKFALDMGDAYRQQTFVSVYQRTYRAFVQRYTATHAQLVDQPALPGRAYRQGGTQFRTDALPLGQTREHLLFTARGNDGVAAALCGTLGSQNLGNHAASADIAARAARHRLQRR